MGANLLMLGGGASGLGGLFGGGMTSGGMDPRLAVRLKNLPYTEEDIIEDQRRATRTSAVTVADDNDPNFDDW